MKRLVLLAILLISLIPLTFFTRPAAAADPWASAYADWQYRTAVTVSNSGSSDLSDFQVEVTLDSNWPGWAHVNQDGSDIRFATADGTTIPYYIESWDYTNKNAVIWIKVPSIPAGGTTVYLYYGNPSATSESNGDAVFEFFDDFSGTALDTTKWVVQNGGGSGSVSLTTIDGASVVAMNAPDINNRIQITASYSTSGSDCLVEVKAYADSNVGDGFLVGFSDGTMISSSEDSPQDSYQYEFSRSLLQYSAIAKRVSGTRTALTSSAFTANSGTWYVAGLAWIGNNLYAFKDYTQVLSASDTTFSSFTNIFIGVDSGTWYFDWIRVRKYADPEPTVSVSTTEETNPTTSGHTITLSLKDNAGNSLSGVSLTVTDENGNTVLSGTYSDGDTITLAGGTYNFLATKAGYIRAEQNGVSISADTTVSLTLTAIPTPSISYSPNPSHVGDTVTATASSSNLPSGYTYSYEYRFEDGSGNVLQDWSTTNTFKVPQSLAHGTLVIKARVKVQETGDYSNEGSVTVSIANSPPSAPTDISADKSPLSVGDTVTFTTSGSTDPDGDSITYQIKIEDVTDPNNPTLLVDWTNAPVQLTITDTLYQHSLKVYARASDGSAYSSEYSEVFTVSNKPPTAPTGISISTKVFRIGQTATITASGSTDPDGDQITYEYKIVDATTNTVLQDWSTTNTYNFSGTSHLHHEITVYARAYDGAVYSAAFSRTFYVMPGDTIATYPFDLSKVQAMSVYNLSQSIDLNLAKQLLDLDDNYMTLYDVYLTHTGEKVFVYLKLESNKITFYYTNPFGPFLAPQDTNPGSSTTTDIYATKESDYLLQFLRDINALPSAVAKTTEIYSAEAPSDGGYVHIYLWSRTLPETGGTTINTPVYTTNPKVLLQYSVYVSGWTLSYSSFYLNFYDLSDENSDVNREISFYSESYSSASTYKESALYPFDVGLFESYTNSSKFGFYVSAHEDGFVHGYVRMRLLVMSTTNTTSSIADAENVYYVKPLPLPKTVTLYFYDDLGNPLNGVTLSEDGVILGVFNNGDKYTFPQTGTVTLTATKTHYADLTKEFNLNELSSLTFALSRESYNVTIKVVDENSVPVTPFSLYLDGAFLGQFNSTTTIPVKYGEHTFEAYDSEGYKGTVTKMIDGPTNVTITVEHPVTVTFIIYDNNNTELTGVTLKIDHNTTRLIDSGAQIQVMKGSHSFQFSKDGYLTTTLQVEVTSDTTLTVWLMQGNEIGNVTEIGGVHITDITPINPYAKAFLDNNGTFGNTVRQAILSDPLVNALLPQLLILAIVIFILVQTHSPPAGIAGALAMQAMWIMFLGEAPNLKNSSLTFMLITFLVAWTLWDLFYNYARET